MSDEVKTAADVSHSSEAAISDAISRIMEHPELISMVASALGGNAAADGNKTNDSENATSLPVASNGGDALPTFAPMLEKLRGLGANSKSGKDGSRHEQLLCALKPYLCDSRRDAVDFILKISQLSGLMGLLK